MPSVYVLHAVRTARFIGLLVAFYAIVVYPACDEYNDSIAFEVTPERATLVVGETLQLNLDDEFTGEATITWLSRDESVATVDMTGLVRAVGEGATVIDITRLEEDGDGNLQAVISDTVEITVEPSQGGGKLEESVTDLGVKALEAVGPIACIDDGGVSTDFGALSLSCGLAFTHADGFVVFDFVTRTTVYEQDDIGGTIGALFAAAPITFGDDAAFLLAGATGDGFADTEGNRSLAFGPTAYDAFPAGGDPFTGWATTAGPGRGFCTIGPDADSSFGFDRLNCFPAQIFDGEAVSAFNIRAGLDSPGFYLTRDVQSNVYFNDGSNTGFGTPIFTVGIDARKIRLAGDGAGNWLGGITLFGDDQVGIFSYTEGEAPVYVGDVDVADGPVDLSLKYRADNTWDLLTSGFNDDRVTYINLNPNGTVNDRIFFDGPSKGGLGHVTWVNDSVEDIFAGSYFQTGRAFLGIGVRDVP